MGQPLLITEVEDGNFIGLFVPVRINDNGEYICLLDKVPDLTKLIWATVNRTLILECP